MEHGTSQEFCQDPKPVVLGPPLPATHSALLPSAEREKAEDQVRPQLGASWKPWCPGRPPIPVETRPAASLPFT